MIHFLRLIRPINLIIIAITMYGVRFYVLTINYIQPIHDDLIDFSLLVFSTLLIAAAGNIINDYFDVRADRINKPEKLILTKFIKRRWAILIHWIFNGIAFSIAMYLSARYESLWFVFIHLLSINALWFYSMLFKRKIMIGNIMIAALTALIPVLVVTYFKVGNSHSLPYSEFDSKTWGVSIDFSFIYLLATFAFIQNFAREIIKDIQDVKGDVLIYVKSLPMVIGNKSALWVASFLLLLLPLFGIFFIGINLHTAFGEYSIWVVGLPFIVAAGLNLFVLGLIVKFGDQHLKLYDALLKISMLIGVLSTFHIALLLQ
jgi:4-hydroxybenzoate polyprenyltransferase